MANDSRSYVSKSKQYTGKKNINAVRGPRVETINPVNYTPNVPRSPGAGPSGSTPIVNAGAGGTSVTRTLPAPGNVTVSRSRDFPGFDPDAGPGPVYGERSE